MNVGLNVCRYMSDFVAKRPNNVRVWNPKRLGKIQVLRQYNRTRFGYKTMYSKASISGYYPLPPDEIQTRDIIKPIEINKYREYKTYMHYDGALKKFPNPQRVNHGKGVITWDSPYFL